MIAACSIVTADDAVANVGPDGPADANQDVQLSGNVHMKITNGVDPLR
jgi:hypothetical protein